MTSTNIFARALPVPHGPRQRKRKPRVPRTLLSVFAEHAWRKLVNVVDGQRLRWVPVHAAWPRIEARKGDTLFAAHVDNAGRLCPIAKMRVVYRGELFGWNWRLPHTEWIGPERDPRTEVIVGTDGTPMFFGRPLPPDVVRALRFEDIASLPPALPLDDDGRLTEHNLAHPLRALSAESADELAALSWI